MAARLSEQEKKVLDKFVKTIEQTAPEKRERLLTFCEGAAYVLAQQREEKTA